ncbi:innexin Vnx-d5.2 [Ichnoviriform fugitivi]|uniref:Innexin Vnx-d5.2 n=1 Tax=Ichnoviriform fugitivi TaxID=265522 RepID=Q6Q2K8_9VIRU|nr:innexin Vnx-d5.2 [Ichnoviriform fugitivi]AAS79822.1 innexin Vnx-d5.2 [Ichnoviriform fugitivi]
MMSLVDLKSLLCGLFEVQTITIDNMLFRLHYRVTVTILAIFTLFTALRQLFMDPIDCDFVGLSRPFHNTYCYIHPTFLVERMLTDELNKTVPFPGFSGDTAEDKLKVYSYYQWISIVLVLKATLLYIPHYIWKCWEGGKIQSLAGELDVAVLSEDTLNRRVTSLVDYLFSQLHSHNRYAYQYMTCELLNVITIVAQIWLMNVFIGKDFHLYGIEVIAFNQQQGKESRLNPMERLFPTITMCTYKKNVTNGIVENINGICLLTQNSANQKMFVFLWFWYHILATIGVFYTIFRITTLFSSSLRYYEFRSNSKKNIPYDIDVVYQNLWIGDWFLLKMLRMNLNTLAYKELISLMAQRFGCCVCSVGSECIPLTRGVSTDV